jgi:hypothetical protein
MEYGFWQAMTANMREIVSCHTDREQPTGYCVVRQVDPFGVMGSLHEVLPVLTEN